MAETTSPRPPSRCSATAGARASAPTRSSSARTTRASSRRCWSRPCARAERPEGALAACPLLAEGEAARLAAWAAPPPTGAPLAPAPERVLARGAADPDERHALRRVARRARRPQLRRAGRAAADVAARLPPAAAAGVVALWLPRSVEQLVAVLAAWRRGAAYVPIGLAWPRERRAFLVDDVGAAALLATSDRAADAACACRVVSADDASAPASSPDAPALVTPPEALAYVMFTSGSTGTPKGVPIRHRSVAHLVSATEGRYPRTATLGLSTDYTFDVFVHVLLVGWIRAAGVVLFDPVEALVGAAHAQLLDATCLSSVPSVVAAAGALPPQIVLVDVAGEALTARAADVARGTRLLNYYGPTECCVYATCRHVPADGDPAARVVHRRAAAGRDVPRGRDPRRRTGLRAGRRVGRAAPRRSAARRRLLAARGADAPRLRGGARPARLPHRRPLPLARRRRARLRRPHRPA